MSHAECLADRKRFRVAHACGFPLIAYPLKAAGLLRAGFAAVRGTEAPAVERGQTVDHCPQCRGDLRMTWEEFQAALGEAFRP
jgi:hypothetical protein